MPLTLYGSLGQSTGYTLQFVYTNLCTDFETPEDYPYTGGRALIYGGTAYQYSNGLSTSIGTAPNLTVTVVQPTVGTYNMFLQGTASYSYAGFEGHSVSVLASVYSMTSSSGATTIPGSIYIYYTGYYVGGTTIALGATSTNTAPFTLNRGFNCPV
ncbi:MAG: hypothetical protein PHQ14_08945 [Chromatiales bacterium]|jgi:hypothetical protein|nr:hypothetical protein [Chromatiales bacterium]MDX9767660.1 hypothetical protein [Ectothiorhodospiraceae bacterium]